MQINAQNNLKSCLLVSMINITVAGVVNAALIPEKQASKVNNYWLTQDIDSEKNTLELAVLAEINKARTNPTVYADWLAEMKKYYYDGWLKIPGQRAIRINQGWEKIDELIGELRDRSPLPPLNSVSELDVAAKELLTEQNTRNNGGYSTQTVDTLTQINSRYGDFAANSSYGETAEIIVMQLVVENGVSHNIFNPDFQLSGVACKSVDNYDNYCSIVFTNELTQTVGNESKSDPTNVVTEEDSIPENLNQLLQEEGVLADNDQIIPSDDSRYDSYPFDGVAGQTIVITLESDDFDPYLAVVDSQNQIIAEHDDISEQNSNSRLTVTLFADGVYYIIVNSYDPNGRGEYTLTVSE